MTKKRPIKIPLNSSADVDRVMKSTYKLKGTNIYINRDLTPLERAELKKLIQERKEKIATSTALGENVFWRISGGKVVKVPKK